MLSEAADGIASSTNLYSESRWKPVYRYNYKENSFSLRAGVCTDTVIFFWIGTRYTNPFRAVLRHMGHYMCEYVSGTPNIGKLLYMMHPECVIWRPDIPQYGSSRSTHANARVVCHFSCLAYNTANTNDTLSLISLLVYMKLSNCCHGSHNKWQVKKC